MNKVYPVIQAFGPQRCTAMQMTPGDIPQSSIYLVLNNFCLFYMPFVSSHKSLSQIPKKQESESDSEISVHKVY